MTMHVRMKMTMNMMMMIVTMMIKKMLLMMMMTQVRVKREESKGDLETKLNVVDDEERR